MENTKYGKRREGRWTPIRAKAQDTRANPNSWETHLVRKRWGHWTPTGIEPTDYDEDDEVYIYICIYVCMFVCRHAIYLYIYFIIIVILSGWPYPTEVTWPLILKIVCLIPAITAWQCLLCNNYGYNRNFDWLVYASMFVYSMCMHVLFKYSKYAYSVYSLYCIYMYEYTYYCV